MNRNQFSTTATHAQDKFFIEEIGYKFGEQDDSDSGEDFDYGDEAGEDFEEAKIDLIDYITTMPLDHLHE